MPDYYDFVEMPRNLTKKQHAHLVDHWDEFLNHTGAATVVQYFNDFSSKEDLYERVCADLGLEPVETIPSLEDLARDVISLAQTGGMPESFWSTDSRIARACTVLGVEPEEAMIL